ncbi:thioredoxin family protein [Thermodesulfobacteriota bacterium]
MSQDDVTQIRVGNSPVGIIGIKTVMEDMAEEYGDGPDHEVLEELLSRLGKRNFIPEIAKEEYGKAFLREFKKFMGTPFEEESPEGLEIKVLGPGCAQCDRLVQELMQVMGEVGITAGIEHVRDIKEIGKYGVMGTPALLINGEVKSVGSVPPKSKIIKWLKET